MFEENSQQQIDRPKICVAIRKRPLSQKEINRGDQDIIDIRIPRSVVVKETKTKVDLTKYIQEHQYIFDAAYDETSNNQQLYQQLIRPLIDAAFNKAKVTCFAYGQTGSGKTYTMVGDSGSDTSPAVPGLYLLAAQDIFLLIERPEFNEIQIWVSLYEIYCGKLYDLLNDRQQLNAREDAKAQVNIVGLSEKRINNVHSLMQLITVGMEKRAAGKTAQNDDSSRSHAILQINLKMNNQLFGKMSFIDLAGSERAADVTDQDKQTRIDGAEINKSLLALKECIRALDQQKRHLPFRGSTLTQVLKDSFIGNCKTVMIGNISPGFSCSENTLNTLRYAYRVKELKNSSEQQQQQLTPEELLQQQLFLPRQISKSKQSMANPQTNINNNNNNLNSNWDQQNTQFQQQKKIRQSMPVQINPMQMQPQLQPQMQPQYLFNNGQMVQMGQMGQVQNMNFYNQNRQMNMQNDDQNSIEEENNLLLNEIEEARPNFVQLHQFENHTNINMNIQQQMQQQQQQQQQQQINFQQQPQLMGQMSVESLNQPNKQIQQIQQQQPQQLQVQQQQQQQMFSMPQSHQQLQQNLNNQNTNTNNNNIYSRKIDNNSHIIQMKSNNHFHNPTQQPLSNLTNMIQPNPNNQESVNDQYFKMQQQQQQLFMNNVQNENIHPLENQQQFTSVNKLNSINQQQYSNSNQFSAANSNNGNNLMNEMRTDEKDLEDISSQHERLIQIILQEEEEIIMLHRKHIDDMVDLTKQEMTILQQVDKPGSDVDTYVDNLDQVFDKKIALIMNIKNRVLQFKQHLKEEENLSYKFYEKKNQVIDGIQQKNEYYSNELIDNQLLTELK